MYYPSPAAACQPSPASCAAGCMGRAARRMGSQGKKQRSRTVKQGAGGRGQGPGARGPGAGEEQGSRPKGCRRVPWARKCPLFNEAWLSRFLRSSAIILRLSGVFGRGGGRPKRRGVARWRIRATHADAHHRNDRAICGRGWPLPTGLRTRGLLASSCDRCSSLPCHLVCEEAARCQCPGRVLARQR